MSEDQKILGAHPRVSEALLDLAARIEAGEGADDELDGRIYDAMSGPGLGSALEAVLDRTKRPNWLPRYTTSLDAVTALLERVLPGWVVATLGQNDDRSWWSELRQGHLTSYDKVALSHLRCSSAARALLASILRALAGGKH